MKIADVFGLRYRILIEPGLPPFRPYGSSTSLLRKRWCLVVHTKSGKRKLAFARSQDGITVQQFVMTARRQFGYAALGV